MEGGGHSDSPPARPDMETVKCTVRVPGVIPQGDDHRAFWPDTATLSSRTFGLFFGNHGFCGTSTRRIRFCSFV